MNRKTYIVTVNDYLHQHAKEHVRKDNNGSLNTPVWDENDDYKKAMHSDEHHYGQTREVATG